MHELLEQVSFQHQVILTLLALLVLSIAINFIIAFLALKASQGGDNPYRHAFGDVPNLRPDGGYQPRAGVTPTSPPNAGSSGRMPREPFTERAR